MPNTNNTTAATEEPSSRKRRRRWGEAPNPAPTTAVGSSSRTTTTTTTADATTTTNTAAPDAKAKALALQGSIRQRLAALKQQQQQQQHAASGSSSSSSAGAGGSGTRTTAAAITSRKRPADAPPPGVAVKKAKHYELDLSTTAPTFRDGGSTTTATSTTTDPTHSSINKKKHDQHNNPYLAHWEAPKPSSQNDKDKDHDSNNSRTRTSGSSTTMDHVDDRLLLRTAKRRIPHKSFSFLEPGTFVEIGKRKRAKAANAAKSGFVSGRKVGQFVQAQDMMRNVYGKSTAAAHDDDDIDEAPSECVPRADADYDNTSTMPRVLEWWDVELLPSKLKKQVAQQEGKALSKQSQAQLQQLTTGTDRKSNASSTNVGQEGTDDKTNDENGAEVLQQQCFEQASLSYSKTAELVQHIVPIRTGPVQPPPQPTLQLTKRERKRQRKLRRAERQRELQDMQAAGLVAPPEPRLTLKNFIQVLGDQAFLDPSQMEQKVVEQMQARQRMHMERNEANRLTKEQRSEKRKKKLAEDTSQAVSVALFWVKDMSHPYHRTKVDLNAQQNNLTGGVLECQHPPLACVICEGGPKAIKRYTRLMTVRMKWGGTDDAGSDAEEGEGEAATHKFNPDNKCELVWTGMGAKRLFKGFVFQSCETSEMARKVLAAKGVGHFWDQVLSMANGKGESFHLRLATDEHEDVEMQDDS